MTSSSPLRIACHGSFLFYQRIRTMLWRVLCLFGHDILLSHVRTVHCLSTACVGLCLSPALLCCICIDSLFPVDEYQLRNVLFPLHSYFSLLFHTTNVISRSCVSISSCHILSLSPPSFCLRQAFRHFDCWWQLMSAPLSLVCFLFVLLPSVSRIHSAQQFLHLLEQLSLLFSSFLPYHLYSLSDSLTLQFLSCGRSFPWLHPTSLHSHSSSFLFHFCSYAQPGFDWTTTLHNASLA